MARKRAIPKKKKATKLTKVENVKLSDIDIPSDWCLKDGITQSILSAYLCCPFKGLMKLNRWTTHANRSNFRFGSAFHEMLDKAYTAKKAPSQVISKKRLSTFIDVSDDYGAKEAQQREDDKAVLFVILDVYFERFADDFTKKKFKRVEQTWAVPYAGATLRGKIDGEFLDKNAKTWMMEHKTKSRIDEETLMLKLAIDFQNLMYITMYELEKKKKVRGTLYNVIRNPGLRRKAAETLKEFTARIRADIESRPEHYFKRMDVVYSERDKKDFREELATILKELQARLDKGASAFYKNRFACEMPFKCEFLPACSSGHLGGFHQAETLFPEL